MDNTALHKHLTLSFLRTLRGRDNPEEEGSGESQFGLIPSSADSNTALTPSPEASKALVDSIRPHPLLKKSSQFSGIDHHLTPDTTNNIEATQHYPQKRLEQQLAQQLQLGHKLAHRRRLVPRR